MVKRFTWIWMTVVLSVFTVNLHAQDWKSIITGIASAVGDKVTGNNSLEGTWKYAGPDCKFSSDNFLATAENSQPRRWRNRWVAFSKR